MSCVAVTCEMPRGRKITKTVGRHREVTHNGLWPKKAGSCGGLEGVNAKAIVIPRGACGCKRSKHSKWAYVTRSG